jgi:signal transduction histidine kinase
MTDAPVPRPEPREAASILRHELINPVNQILGYADLLVDDADRQGWSSTAEALRSIRDLGRRARDSIDEALIRGPGLHPGHPPDLMAMAEAVALISDAIGEACLKLEDGSSRVPDRAGYLDDLGLIRHAAALLSEMARRASAAKGEGP